MRVDYLSLDVVEVALSERNLIALLNKVRRSGSHRTLVFNEPVEDDGALPGEKPQHVRLVVKAEPDAQHYEGREYPPGEVAPEDLLEPAERRPSPEVVEVRRDQDELPTRLINTTDLPSRVGW